jgi:hypothetical protein
MENIKDFVYDEQVYKAVKEIDRDCTGCEFIENDRACYLACAYHYCSNRNGIIWLKKESDMAKEQNVLAKQEGGQHYKKLGIEPVEYIQANKLSFFEGNVVKYVTRHKDKKGAEDIRKAIHYLEMILKFEYSQDNSQDINQESK